MYRKSLSEEQDPTAEGGRALGPRGKIPMELLWGLFREDDKDENTF